MSEKFKNYTKTEAAIDAVSIFLKKLKPHDYFNITLFGADYNNLFFSQSILAKPEIIINCINILKNIINFYDCIENSILDFCFKYKQEINTNVCDESVEKIMILITDGQICNKNSLLTMIKKKIDFVDEFHKKLPDKFPLSFYQHYYNWYW